MQEFTGHYIVSSKTGHIFDDNTVNLTIHHRIVKCVEVGTIVIHSGIAVVTEYSDELNIFKLIEISLTDLALVSQGILLYVLTVFIR